MPDFRGLNYHECVWLASEYGVVISPEGVPSGRVEEQSIPASSIDTVDPPQDDTGAPIVPAEQDKSHEGKVKQGQVIQLTFSTQKRQPNGNVAERTGD